MSGLSRRGGGASDRKDIFERVDISADYVDADVKSTFFNVDSSGGVINYTPPTLTINDKGIVKIIKDKTGDAGTNKIVILATVLGEETPEVASAYGSIEIRWNGTNWERLREDKNLFDYNNETQTFEPKDTLTLLVNAIKAGAKAVTKQQNYADFQNLGANVSSDGVSYSNLNIPTGSNVADSSGTYEGTPGLDQDIPGAFDGNISTQWTITTGGTPTIGVIWDTPQTIGAYRWAAREVGGAGDNYGPSSWIIETYNGSTWTQVATGQQLVSPGHNIFTNYFNIPIGTYHGIRITWVDGLHSSIRSITEFEAYNANVATTSNTVESNLTDSGVVVSVLKAYDENDVLITDESKVLIEYSTDDGSTWSTQTTLETFNNSENVNSTGIFQFRFAPVGDQKISRIDRVGPSSILQANAAGFTFTLDGKNEFVFDTNNGIQAKKLAIGEQAKVDEVAYGNFVNIGVSVDDDGQSYGNAMTIIDENLVATLDPPEASFNHSHNTDAQAKLNFTDVYTGPKIGHDFSPTATMEVDLGAPYLIAGLNIGLSNISSSIVLRGSNTAITGPWTELGSVGPTISNLQGLIQNIVEYRYLQVERVGSTGGANGIVNLRQGEIATSTNGIETNFGESNILVSKLNAYDENGDLITDETKVLVEYTTDNGSNWSTQETLASFNASETVNSAGVFNVRFAAVGVQRISKIEKQGPNAFLNVGQNGFDFEIDGQKKFQFSEQNGVSVEGVSINNRLDTIENNPTQEVADIAARDALTPNDGDIVKVTDAGGAVTKVYKWDDGGSQWNDITDLSQANLVEVQDRISALENKPSSEVADIAARDALTPVQDEIVQVLDAGSGDPAVYKWNGSTWEDITSLSGGIALVKAQDAQTDATEALALNILTENLPSETITLNSATPEMTFEMFDDDHASKTHELNFKVYIKALAQSPQTYDIARFNIKLKHSKHDSLDNYGFIVDGETYALVNESDQHKIENMRTLHEAGKVSVSGYQSVSIKNDNYNFSPLPDYNINSIDFKLTRENDKFKLYVKPTYDQTSTDTTFDCSAMIEYYG